MTVLDEKVIAVTIIGILYILQWVLESKTVFRFIINFFLVVTIVVCLTDLFGIYPVYENFFSFSSLK
jgi:hypothetical protein